MPFLVKQSFTSGEITERMDARFDMAKYRNSCKKLLNGYALPHGPVMRRPGTRYIAEVADSSKKTRNVPFEFSETQAYNLEFGNLYVRFYMDGGQIQKTTADTWVTGTAHVVDDWVVESTIVYRCVTAHTGGTFATDLAAIKWIATEIYQTTTTYTEAELFELKFCQSADTLFIFHNSHPPATLTRTGHTAWVLSDIDFIEEPFVYNYMGSDVTITPSGTTGTVTLTASEALFSSDHVGSVFSLNAGFAEVTVYTSTTVVTAVTSTDFSGTGAADDWEESEWSAHRGYPSCGNFFEQRLCLAATLLSPQTIWGSRSGLENFYDFSVVDPADIVDSDAVTYTIASDQVNIIKWLSPTNVLAIGTTGGEWILSGNGSPVTPTSVQVVRQSTHGSIALQPVMLGSVHLFTQKGGRVVREFRYSFEEDSFQSIDLSIMAEHLTRTRKIVDWAYQQSPNSILWCVLDDGDVIGLTYLRQHEVTGWHHHETEGEFESVAVIPGDDTDEVWFVVKRTIDSATVRYIERLDPEFNPTSTDPTTAFYVDSGLTYDGASTSTITGLDHLEGEEVAILGDGAVQPSKTVASGSITLQNAVEYAQIGLAYNTDLEPMPIELSGDESTSMGRTKSVISADISYINCSSMQIGTTFDDLEEVIFRRTSDNLGEYVPLSTGHKRKLIANRYDEVATLCIRQSSPLPLIIRGIAYEMEVS